MKNVFAALLVSTIFSCQAQSDSSYKLNPEAFEKGFSEANTQVLDVRTATEFNMGHIKSTLQADWNNKTQFYDRIQYLDKSKTVYVYCLAGGRSSAAATWMRDNGFSKVLELKGGINAWKNAGKPLEGQVNIPQMTMQDYLASIPAGKTVLVDFGASWCPPCIKMAPVITDLENAGPADFKLIKVDAGIHTDVMKALQIGPIPVFIVYKNGKETWRKEGIVTKEELLSVLK